jgi:hypothetical protein
MDYYIMRRLYETPRKMKKHLIIENCQECPFFIDAWAKNCRESCKKTGKSIPYKDTDKGYPIPDFCPLPDEPETKLTMTCTPLPDCKDCGLQNSENCNTCPKLNSEGLDNFEEK